MEGKSFLLDGSPVRARLLARAPYPQDAMERIASGDDPASGDDRSSLRDSFDPDGSWGVLYVSDSGAGFFSARSEPTMLGFSVNRGEDTPEPVHLLFTERGRATLEVDRAKRLPGKLGALVSRIVAGDDTVLVRWPGTDGPRELRFLVTHGDIDAFARAFGELRD